FILWRWTLGRGVGLVVSFVLGLSAIHWIAGVLYLLPGYEELDPQLVAAGVRASFQGLCAFCLGALAVSPLRPPQPAPTRSGALPAGALGWPYILIGAVMYGILWPRIGRMASIGALVAAGSNYVVLGICLRCWQADRARLTRWVGVSLL